MRIRAVSNLQINFLAVLRNRANFGLLWFRDLFLSVPNLAPALDEKVPVLVNGNYLKLAP